MTRAGAFWRWLADLVTGHPRKVIAVFVMITVAFAVVSPPFRIFVDLDEMMPQTHPFIRANNEAVRNFGNENTVALAFDPEAGVDPGVALAAVRDVTAALERTPGVVRSSLLSVTAPSVRDIRGSAEGMEAPQFANGLPAGGEALSAEIAARLARNPAYADLLVGKPAGSLLAYVEFRKDAEGYRGIEDKVQAAITSGGKAGVKVHVAGQPIVLAVMERYSQRVFLILPVTLLIVGLLHLEAFRTLQGFALPLVSALLAVGWAMGVMGILGFQLDAFNATAPVLVLAMVAGHAVQIFKRFYEDFECGEAVADPRERSVAAVHSSLIAIGPVMLAAGSVGALSFFSLSIFEMKTIRSFGIAVGSGVIAGMVIELFFIPAVRVLLPPPKSRPHASGGVTMWDRIVLWACEATAVAEGRRRILAGGLLFIIVAGCGAALVKVNNSVPDNFAAFTKVRRDEAFFQTETAGSNAFFLLIDTAKPDGAREPTLLCQVERAAEVISANPQVSKTYSIVDILRAIDRAARSVPEGRSLCNPSWTAELVGQYLLLYASSGNPEDVQSYLNFDQSRVILRFIAKIDDLRLSEGLRSNEVPRAAKLFPEGVKVQFGGTGSTPLALNERMIDVKTWNLVLMLSIVVVVSGLLLGSPVVGLLVALPSVFSVLGIFGLMGFLGIPLNVATVTIASIAVGLGADYAIYFAFRFRIAVKRESNLRAALRQTYLTAGKAALYVATAVAAGYSTLMLSLGFNVHLWLGLLVSFGMLVSVAATLTVFVSLLATLDGWLVGHKPQGSP